MEDLEKKEATQEVADQGQTNPEVKPAEELTAQEANVQVKENPLLDNPGEGSTTVQVVEGDESSETEEAPQTEQTEATSERHIVEAVEGHTFVLVEDQKEVTELQFIHKEMKNGELSLVANGFRNEELLDILISRTETLNQKLHSSFNVAALQALRSAKRQFDLRNEMRNKQNVRGTNMPEAMNGKALRELEQSKK